MHSLTLALRPGAWYSFISRKSDPDFKRFAERVWKRDIYMCQYCGFQARDYQEVVNLDGNYSNNRLSNMVTACVFCTQCFFLEAVGKGGYGGGTLIYLPQLSQQSLNGLCHVFFCAVANATSYRNDAQNIYRSLKLRAQYVEDKLGENMSNPATLAQILIDGMVKEQQMLANKIFRDLRLLPARSRFKKQISAWAEAARAEMS